MTGKNRKFLIAAAVIFLLPVAGGNLYAEPYLFTSPQKKATATQFYSDADNFIDVRYYADLEFNKFFGVISFQNSDLSQVGQTNMLQVGAAAQFGSVYTALYYGGNALALPAQTYDEDKDGKRIYADWPDLFLTNGVLPLNEASVLIGVADMGFRLSFVSTYNSNNLRDFYNRKIPAYVLNAADPKALQPIESYLGEHGSLNPEIAWGMTKELLPGRGIKPKLHIDLDFFRDYEKYDAGLGEIINKSENEFTLGITAAAGGFSLINNNGFDLGVDLWYTLHLKLFDNEYNRKQENYDSVAEIASVAVIPGKIEHFTGKKVRSGGIADVYNSFNPDKPYPEPFDYYETGYNNHLITPYLYASWSGDRLALSAELGLEFGIEGRSETGLITAYSSPKKHGTYTETIAFSFVPSLCLGMQYAVIRDKLYLNVGSEIQILVIKSESSDIDTYVNGDKDPNVGTIKKIENKFVDDLGRGTFTKLSAGLTFNITPNLGLQAMCGVGMNTNNQVSLFGTDGSADKTNGLAVFSQIMATVKF